MIDFHAHILPAVDHGCDSVSMAEWQLRAAADAGVSLLMATPHFYPERHRVSDFLQSREEASHKMKEAGLAEILPWRLGAEVLLCEGLHRMENLSSLCLEGTRLLLVELPTGEVTEGMYKALSDIQTECSLAVVLAHIERYPRDVVERALSFVPYAQINTAAFLSFFDGLRALDYAERGVLWALGSDIHQKGNAYKKMAKAEKKHPRLFAEIEEKTEMLLSRYS